MRAFLRNITFLRRLYRHIRTMLYELGPLVCLFANMQILMRKTHRKNLRNIVHYVANLQNKSVPAVYWDIFVKCLASSGLYKDYARLHFYEKTVREASRYCTNIRQSRYLLHLKTIEAENIFEEKPLFNKTFQQFIKRDTFYVTADTPIEEFNEFTGRHAVFMAKLPNSKKGEGIWLVDRAFYPNSEDLLDLLKEKGTTLLEERVHNHKDLNEFSKTSLNTMRVMTVRLPEGVKIISAYLKFSVTGGIMDNLSQGGYACPIDIETGIVRKGMINTELGSEFVEVHPEGFFLPGKKIPCWEQVVAMAKEATLFMDDVYYGAWDIAVTDEGPLIIESNNVPGITYQVLTDIPSNYDIKRAYQFAKKNKRLKRKMNNHPQVTT